MQDDPSRLKPRKTPRQQRSRHVVETIVEAATRVLIEQGQSDFTTNRVAERAGVSIGSLYQYFPNKQSLIAELTCRRFEQIRDALVPAFQKAMDLPCEEGVRLIVRATVQVLSEHPQLSRLLEVDFVGIAASEATVARREAALQALMQHAVAHSAAKQSPTLSRPPAHTAQICFVLCRALATSVSLYQIPALSAAELEAELCQQLLFTLGYL